MIANFIEYTNAIHQANSEDEICRIVEAAEVMYLRGELQMADDEWPRLTNVISSRIDELNTKPLEAA